MTKLNHTRFRFDADADRPVGAIRSLQEIRDRDFGEVAYVWEVSQSGYITKFELLERFHSARHDYDTSQSSQFLPALCHYDNGSSHYQPFFLEQGGIWPCVNKPVPEMSNEFQTFFTLEEATVYSDYLKGNEDYIAAVKAYHDSLDREDYGYGDSYFDL